MSERPERSLFAALGPGLLFCAAAVGVSHLVQSTRAGAVFGLELFGLVILANVVKYPAFRFGPHYAAATGTSLLEGYRRQGKWALVVYALLTVGTMFTVQAAVTVVTAGLAIAVLGVPAGPVLVSAVLLGVCAALLAVGRYHLLDRVTKVLVAVLTVSTLVATVLALPRLDFSSFAVVPDLARLDTKAVFFLAALVGWMPSAIDVSVWQSLWTLAGGEDRGRRVSLRESSFDFHVGYVGTASLALCFLVMGAGVVFGTGQQIPDSAAGFAARVVQLYTETLGAWAGPIVGVAAFAVMFSTTLTVLDGFPRAIATLVRRFVSAEEPERAGRQEEDRIYWASLVALALGALLVLALFLKGLKGLIDIATTLSFLTAPMLSVLNHRAVTGAEVPDEARPRLWLIRMSLVCIVVQAAFAAWYLVFRYA